MKELGKKIADLEGKIAKVEAENSRINKRKKDLEANMRVCLRNNK